MVSLLSRSGVLTEIISPRSGNKILSLACAAGQIRNLNVQEHVSYTLLNGANIPTPKFGVAKSAKECEDHATKLNTKNLVLKAQVLAGGRGKGHFKNGLKGGVRVVDTPCEAGEIGGQMINQLLVTKQTGAAGRICNSVMVAERKFPRREFYFAVMMERAFNGPVIIASSQGGVNIEEVAEENPDAILYEPIDIAKGLTKEKACEIATKVGLGEVADKTGDMLLNMYDLFVKKDALLIEINPYAEDAIEGFYALDAKFRFDDNAEFRQKELFALRDWTQEDPKEVEAAKFDLNYITLDGTIGCMVNGAGLAMATMDIIKLHGGDPANFLDVGGGATAAAVKEAFKIITADPKVHALLVNIFGGIMRCDVIAEGIIAAATDLKLKTPIVCRLQGTRVNEARELIKKSGLRILPRNDLDEAANLAVHLAQIVQLAREVNMDVNFEIPDVDFDGASNKTKTVTENDDQNTHSKFISKCPQVPNQCLSKSDSKCSKPEPKCPEKEPPKCPPKVEEKCPAKEEKPKCPPPKEKCRLPVEKPKCAEPPPPPPKPKCPEKEKPKCPPKVEEKCRLQEPKPKCPEKQEKPKCPPPKDEKPKCPPPPPKDEKPKCPPKDEKPKCPPKDEKPKCPPKDEKPKCPPPPPKDEKPKCPPPPPKDEKPKCPPKDDKPKCPPKDEKPKCPGKEEKPKCPGKEERPKAARKEQKPIPPPKPSKPRCAEEIDEKCPTKKDSSCPKPEGKKDSCGQKPKKTKSPDKGNTVNCAQTKSKPKMKCPFISNVTYCIIEEKPQFVSHNSVDMKQKYPITSAVNKFNTSCLIPKMDSSSTCSGKPAVKKCRLEDETKTCPNDNDNSNSKSPIECKLRCNNTVYKYKYQSPVESIQYINEKSKCDLVPSPNCTLDDETSSNLRIDETIKEYLNEDNSKATNEETNSNCTDNTSSCSSINMTDCIMVRDKSNPSISEGMDHRNIIFSNCRNSRPKTPQISETIEKRSSPAKDICAAAKDMCAAIKSLYESAAASKDINPIESIKNKMDTCIKASSSASAAAPMHQQSSIENPMNNNEATAPVCDKSSPELENNVQTIKKNYHIHSTYDSGSYSTATPTPTPPSPFQIKKKISPGNMVKFSKKEVSKSAPLENLRKSVNYEPKNKSDVKVKSILDAEYCCPPEVKWRFCSTEARKKAATFNVNKIYQPPHHNPKMKKRAASAVYNERKSRSTKPKK